MLALFGERSVNLGFRNVRDLAKRSLHFVEVFRLTLMTVTLTIVGAVHVCS
jgi:hypothetical protein